MQKFINKFNKYTFNEKLAILYFRWYIEGLSWVIGMISLKLQAFFFDLELGQNIRAWGTIGIIKSPGTIIKIGDHASLVSDAMRSSAAPIYSKIKFRTTKPGASIILGHHVGLSGTAITARSKTISIGDGTIIGPNVIITDSDFHALWPPEDRMNNPDFENDRDVFIGKNVWIGMNAIILKGGSIGDNSIIGAGSVVTKYVPTNCVVAGNPARVVKMLGEKE